MNSIIYIVDDDPIQNMLTTQLIKLQDPTMEQMVFNNGQEVLSELESGKLPSIILLDINMPIMDGWEFLEIYQKFDKKASVYMLSSSNNPEDLRRVNIYDFIKGYHLKPINKDIISQILKV